MPYPDVAFWCGAVRPSGGKTVAAKSTTGESLKENFLYLFTFPKLSNAGI